MLENGFGPKIIPKLYLYLLDRCGILNSLISTSSKKEMACKYSRNREIFHFNLNFVLFLQVKKKTMWFLIVVITVFSVNKIECRKSRILESFEYSAINCRAHSASITEFGGIGDGKTLNTRAFQDAVNTLSQYSSNGGAQLFVPAGQWLTGSFNLTSHFTLYLQKDAVLLASQVIIHWFYWILFCCLRILLLCFCKDWWMNRWFLWIELIQDISSWPVIDPLPSYGHGRDAAGGRYISLIFGTNLTDVVITGNLPFLHFHRLKS